MLGDELYAVAYNGQLVARKLMTGEEIWKRKYSSYENMGVGVLELVLTDAKSLMSMPSTEVTAPRSGSIHSSLIAI